MEQSYKIISKGGVGEIEEKRSRFIATVESVNTEEEALTFIKNMKKKYYDAKHNCYAYVIGDDAQIQHASDDGEPSSTAGKPMLDVLLAEGLRNTVVVVTRYFGGILLGTGGLVRAYQGAVKAGLSACSISTMQYGRMLAITCDYGSIGKIKYILSSMDLAEADSSYAADVTTYVVVLPEDEGALIDKVTEATAGAAKIEVQKEGFFEIK